MRIGECDFPREVIRVAEFEKDQIIVAEIVLYAPRFRSDHRLRERQVFEDACGRIDFGEDIAMIWDDAEVTILDCLDDLVEIARAELIDISVESPLLGRFHHFLEEGGSLTANFQPDRRNCFPHLLQ